MLRSSEFYLPLLISILVTGVAITGPGFSCRRHADPVAIVSPAPRDIEGELKALEGRVTALEETIKNPADESPVSEDRE